MSEAEWLACNDLTALLEFLRPSKIDAPDKTRRRVIGTLACFGSGGVGLGFWERLRLGFGPR